MREREKSPQKWIHTTQYWLDDTPDCRPSIGVFPDWARLGCAFGYVQESNQFISEKDNNADADTDTDTNISTIPYRTDSFRRRTRTKANDDLLMKTPY